MIYDLQNLILDMAEEGLMVKVEPVPTNDGTHLSISVRAGDLHAGWAVPVKKLRDNPDELMKGVMWQARKIIQQITQQVLEDES